VSGLRVGAATDVGQVRDHNEDAYLASEALVIVADGIGGHAAGEVASQLAVGVIEEHFMKHKNPQGLVKALENANNEVVKSSAENPSQAGMGTTATVLAVTSARRDALTLTLSQVGDSRCYYFGNDALTQVTEDHTVTAERVRRGELTEEEASTDRQRHMLTRALGIPQVLEVDQWSIKVAQGDRFVVCSDGLCNEVSDQEIAGVLRSLPDPQEAAEELVRLAREHGGRDNITVVVAEADASSQLNDESSIVRLDQRREQPPVVVATAATRRGSQRVVTGRGAIFVLALLAVLFSGWLVLRWYATSAYYVTAEQGQVVIYQGQVGGFLWFHPERKAQTAIPTSQLLPTTRSSLKGKVPEPTLDAAWSYAVNQHNAWKTQQKAISGLAPIK